jgi:hypothetical protein
MNNTNNTKKSTARKAAPAKKATTKKAAPAKKAAPVKATTTPLTDADAKKIVALQAAVTKATDAFEAAVVDQLRAGVSPTALSKALDIANSSVRRIGWRAGFNEPTADWYKAG